MLVLLAASQVLPNLVLLLGMDDSEHLETTLAYVAAGPFIQGPFSLYGPYGHGNLRVLIQAPLYYRLTALVAWPLIAAGLPPVGSCVAAGRAISVIAFAGVLVLIDRISRLDGGSRRAGTWAILLALSSTVIRTSPVTLRPDLLGVFLQTLGAFLVLEVLWNPTNPSRKLAFAYACFALALCVKQHYAASALGSTLLLLRFWKSHRLWRKPVERALLVGLIVTSTYYLAEEVLSSGRMSYAIFVLPSTLRQSDQNKWFHVVGMIFEVTLRSLGLLLLAACSAWAASRRGGKTRLDAALWCFLVLESALFAFLCYGNEGAWVNYAIPSVVYGCILLGRSLSRLVENPPPLWRAVLVALAAVAALFLNLDYARRGTNRLLRRAHEQKALMLDPRLRGVGRKGVYFVGLPQFNRLMGHPEWAHDEWLYGKFESLKAAPPRAIWLRPALTTGPVRIVIVPDDPPFPIPLRPPVVPGLTESLPELGYARSYSLGRLQVWEKRRRPAVRRPGA